MSNRARALGVEPEYFFEYRLRRLTDFINENRDFLNFCIKQKLIYQKNTGSEKKRL
ncbi:unnamed protein product [marine sediment metagenome]|uniref:Uncharacterized protein n=1 Tax=marine sediment metagenome TaxID=412755 RepID=X0ZUH2_9ZZZZ